MDDKSADMLWSQSWVSPAMTEGVATRIPTTLRRSTAPNQDAAGVDAQPGVCLPLLDARHWPQGHAEDGLQGFVLSLRFSPNLTIHFKGNNHKYCRPPDRLHGTRRRPPDRLHGTFCRACRPPAAAKKKLIHAVCFLLFTTVVVFFVACMCVFLCVACICFLCVACMFFFCVACIFLCVACMCFVCPQHLWQCASWSIVNTTYSKACLIASKRQSKRQP